ncbi:pentatricopeptide repeat-containing protein, partial [Quercus suber]
PKSSTHLHTLLEPLLNQSPPHTLSYAPIFQFLTGLNLSKLGQQIHAHLTLRGLKPNSYLAAKMIAMYASSGHLNTAMTLFQKTHHPTVLVYNSILRACALYGYSKTTIDLYFEMNSLGIKGDSFTYPFVLKCCADLSSSWMGKCVHGMNSEVKPNWVTIMSVLPACAESSDLEHGRRIHDFAIRIGLDSNAFVLTALVAMYAKCGSLADARQCFDRIREKNLVTWNTMITAYASHGCGMECVWTFEDMIREGIQPDTITFTGLLSGCGHSGLVDFGLKYFNCMNKEHSINPRVEHYACVVDLLARVGRLVEAKELIDQMPMQAGPSIWGALLAACRSHRNLEIAEIAARKLFVLEPENSGNYVLLSNMYAEVGKWKEVDNLRALLKFHGMKKSPGCSWMR